MNKKQVFISYKSEERDQALWTRAMLEENGISCWMDTDVPAGANYAEEINAALVNASVIVLIMSRKAQMSEHIKNEVRLASQYSKFIMAFVIEECDMVAGFDFDLPAEQRYNAFIDRADAIDSMVEALRSVLEAREEESYDLKRFLKERSKYLKNKKQREKLMKATKNDEQEKEPRQKSVIKVFPFRFTPYAREYFTAKGPRLSLNIHTFFIVLMALAFALLFSSILFSSSTVNIILLVLPLLSAFVVFIVGEAIAGVVCYFEGKIKSMPLLVALSLVTGYLMTYVIFGIFMTVMELL